MFVEHWDCAAGTTEEYFEDHDGNNDNGNGDGNGNSDGEYSYYDYNEDTLADRSTPGTGVVESFAGAGDIPDDDESEADASASESGTTGGGSGKLFDLEYKYVGVIVFAVACCAVLLPLVVGKYRQWSRHKSLADGDHVGQKNDADDSSSSSSSSSGSKSGAGSDASSGGGTSASGDSNATSTAVTVRRSELEWGGRGAV